MKHEIVVRVEAAKGDIVAADDLIRDYLPFIRGETNKVTGHMRNNDRDDEVSIAMIAFHEAILSYSSLRGAFLNYAAVLIKRKLIDYYRKEKRHIGISSIDESVSENGQETIKDTLKDVNDPYENFTSRDATKEEIFELTQQIAAFGVSLSDVAENCPKQDRTLAACRKALQYAREHPELIEELKVTKRLPMAKLVVGSGVERKTLERHRKYLLVLLLIYSNGYEIIRGHLKQVLLEGGTAQ